MINLKKIIVSIFEAIQKNKLLIILSCLFTTMEVYFFFYKVHYFSSSQPWLLFFFIISLMSRRTKCFLRDWSIFISFLLLFNFSRGIVYFFIKTFDLPIYSHYIIQFESIFTPGTTLAALLQKRFVHLAPTGLLEQAASFIYSFHFCYFLLVGFIIWIHQPKEFWRYTGALLSCAYVSIVICFLIPTIPPWLASKEGLIPNVRNIVKEILASKLGVLYKFADVNPIAAMPSLHVAFPVLGFMALTYHFGLKKTWPIIIYLLLVIFSTLLLGAHFIGDILAGIIMGAIFSYIFYNKLVCSKRYSDEVTSSQLGSHIAIILICIFGVSLVSLLLSVF